MRGLRFYPKSLERGCRSEKALKLAIAEMYVMDRNPPPMLACPLTLIHAPMPLSLDVR